jgi:hypothetical protein
MSDVNKMTLERMTAAHRDAGAEVELGVLRRERAELLRIGEEIVAENKLLRAQLAELERRVNKLLED